MSYLHLQKKNCHRGMYLAMPTQATSNAIFDRMLQFLKGFNAESTFDIQLIHAGAMMNDRVRSIRDKSETTATSSVWFSKRRRGLISSYGVGTVDQALLATLKSKHHFVRLWGLSNKVVVLDEVHAYNEYTNYLIQALISWLKEMNCSVILMSATLPKKDKERFLRAWGESDAKALPFYTYPRVTVVDHSLVPICASYTSEKSMSIDVVGLDESLEEVSKCVIEALKKGGCGVVIVNTVVRAQALYKMLKLMELPSVDLTLLHSRFPSDERLKVEESVLRKFGKGSITEGRPHSALLIATQIVEQSLDLDFDFMITDLAPIDLLFQRVGRLHRHNRKRHLEHVVPRIFVSGLVSDRFPDLKNTLWEYVYDPYYLIRTWMLMKETKTLSLPDDIDDFVQKVYDNSIDLSEGLSKEQIKFKDQYYARSLAEDKIKNAMGEKIAIEPDQELGEIATEMDSGDEDAGHAKTRLGEESLTIVPFCVEEGGWRLNPSAELFDPQKPVDSALSRDIYMKQLKTNNKALISKLLEEDLPEGFKSNSHLKHIRPLKLFQGVCDVATMVVKLDNELGLVYEYKKDKP